MNKKEQRLYHAIVLLCGAIWSIRNTCQTTLEGLDATNSADILRTAVEGIAHAVGTLFEEL